MTASHEAHLSLVEHFRELRTSVLRALGGIFLGMVACYGFSEELLKLLMGPVRGALADRGQGQMVLHTVTEGFYTYLLIALLGGVILTIPHTFYQFWRFVAPGLKPLERRLTLPFVVMASVWFLLGVVFGFLVIFPYAFYFFLSFGSEMTPMLSVYQYVIFSLRMLAVFGAVFELPVIAYFLARLGLITPEFMRDQRKVAIVLSFVLAAMLTPPDPASQILLALPLLVLYQFGIFSAAWAARSRERNREREEAELDALNAELQEQPQTTAPATSPRPGSPGGLAPFVLESSEGLERLASWPKDEPWW